MLEKSENKTGLKTIFKKVGVSFLLILIIFIFQGIVIGLLTFWNKDFMKNNIWFTMLISQIVMLIITLAIIVFGKRKISEYGFNMANNYKIKKIILLGLGFGFITILVGTISGAKGIKVFEELSFIQIIFVVWIFASLSEEVFFRGLIQTYLSPLIKYRINFCKKTFSLPVLLSAFFFAAMHLPMLAVAEDILTVIIVVGFGFFVGLTAAYYREKSGSLIPALLLHTFANIGAYICEKLFEIV